MSEKMSNDEARLEVLWHLAEGIMFFLHDEDEDDETTEETLQIAQMMAMRIAESMNLTVEHTGEERNFIASIDLSTDARTYLSE